MKSLLYLSLLTILSCNNLPEAPAASTTAKVTTNDYTNFQTQENAGLNMDYLDVYKLKMGDIFLYGNYENFIKDLGLPVKAKVLTKEYIISSRADLDKVVATNKAKDVILCYLGIEMEFPVNNYIIPLTIDFRKTDKHLSYGTTTFDTSYTIKKFQRQFPKSANMPVPSNLSTFEITTTETGERFKHFVLLRKSKDDPNAILTIEFTFENDKLIHILFMNID